MEEVIALRDRNAMLESIVHKLKALYDKPNSDDKYTWLA